MEPFTVLVKCTEVLYSTAESVQLAQLIQKALLDIHRSNTETSMKCAEAAVRSAASSPHPVPYVQVAINEFKRVYFGYEDLLSQTLDHRYLVVFHGEKDLIEDKDAVHSRLMELAGVICKHHVDIDERDNATDFMKLALPAHLAGHVAFRIRDLTPQELRKDETLVHSYVQETYGRDMRGVPTMHRSPRSEFTEAGVAYVQQKRADVRQEVLTAFRNMGLDPDSESLVLV